MKKMRFRGFQLFYHHASSAESMVRQIDEFPSFFTPSGERPLIIDCGSNIGITALEWKSRWPQCQVVCFEPDPNAFAVLEKNMDANDVPGVTCVNAAVTDLDGTTEFFGELSASSDARGNSIDAAWADRGDSSQITVKALRLGPYVAKEPVSFLKLDIEGAEQRVLHDIRDHLGNIEAIHVEVHETDQSREHNSVEAIVQLLGDAGFSIERETRDAAHALPAHLDQWRRSVGASQTQLMCWR